MANKKTNETNIKDKETVSEEQDAKSLKTDDPIQKEKKKIPKYAIYFALILIITALTLYFSLANNFESVISVFTDVNIPYMIYGILCFLGVFLCNSLILFFFARRYKKKYYLHQAMANDCIGNFFNCITPSQTGGQIMQAYTYKKQGVSISNATSCLVMNFIVYQGVMIAFAIIAIIFKFDTVLNTPPLELFKINDVSVALPIWIIAILGFALQILVIVLIFSVSYSKKIHNFLLNHGVNLFAKMRIVKDPDLTRRRLSVQIDSFKVELKNLFINPRFLILIIILNVACFFLRYSIPYFINISIIGSSAEAISAYQYNLWDTVCLTSIHKMATELIPIPGSAGISEAFYATLFVPAYNLENPSAYATASQILWRVITFHVPLLISGLVTAFYKARPRKDEVRQVSENGGITSYLTLQIETIDDRRKTYQTVYNTKQLNKSDIEKWRKEQKGKKKD